MVKRRRPSSWFYKCGKNVLAINALYNVRQWFVLWSYLLWDAGLQIRRGGCFFLGCCVLVVRGKAEAVESGDVVCAKLGCSHLSWAFLCLDWTILYLHWVVLKDFVTALSLFTTCTELSWPFLHVFRTDSFVPRLSFLATWAELAASYLHWAFFLLVRSWPFLGLPWAAPAWPVLSCPSFLSLSFEWFSEDIASRDACPICMFSLPYPKMASAI